MSTFARTLVLLAATMIPMSSFATVTRDGDKVVFTGEVTLEAASQLVEQFDKGARLLVVTSEGGDAAAGMAIANSMLKHDVSIQVDKYCMSACANYLFLAAKEKAMNAGAVLGYHGGILKTGSQVEGQFGDMIASNNAFFEAIQVDDALIKKSFELTKLAKPNMKFAVTSKGKTTEFTTPEAMDAYIAKLRKKKSKFTLKMSIQPTSAMQAYFPSKETLLGFGVKGIVDYPYPASQQAMTAAGKEILGGIELFGDY